MIPGPASHAPDSKRIQSLDGLRALSIGLVVLGHARGTFPAGSEERFGSILTVLGNSSLGVSIFFVLSGFLITSLLVAEKKATEGIKLGAFYLRRVLRIFPPLYTYVGVILALRAFGVISISDKALLAASTFTWNYIRAESWWLGHFWSLCVEEQFYLLWPFLMTFLGVKSLKKVALGIILLAPPVRIASYFIFPHSRDYLDIMLHTRLDSLMFGCGIALVSGDAWFERWKRFSLEKNLHWAAATFVFVLSPFLAREFAGKYTATLGHTLNGLAISVVMLWLIQRPFGRVGRIFNSKAVVHLGLISYSLYIWQQLFCTPLNSTIFGKFPWNIGFAILAAEISYWGIEKPFVMIKEALRQTPAA